MRLLRPTLALLLAGLAAADTLRAAVYIQPITRSKTPTPPTLLAEISYDALDLASETPASEVTSYEQPELPDSTSLVRIGVLDPVTQKWSSSVSVASAENFARGYGPHFLVTVSAAEGAGKGRVVGVTFKGVAVDAGVTRDFGPQAKIVAAERGAQPALNAPVVLSQDGKKVQPPPEKTLLQKYWWVAGIVMLLTLTTGGGGEEK